MNENFPAKALFIGFGPLKHTWNSNSCKIHKENVFFKPNFSVSAVSPSIAHSFPFARLFPFAFDSHVCFFFTSLPRRHFFSRPEKEIAIRIPLNFFIRRFTPLCKLDYAARSAEVGSGEGLLPNLFRERCCAHSPDKGGEWKIVFIPSLLPKNYPIWAVANNPKSPLLHSFFNFNSLSGRISLFSGLSTKFSLVFAAGLMAIHHLWKIFLHATFRFTFRRFSHLIRG